MQLRGRRCLWALSTKPTLGLVTPPSDQDAKLLGAYLQQPGVKCPYCNYELAGCRSGACPECGRELRLVLRGHRSSKVTLVLGIIGLSVPLALSALALAFLAAALIQGPHRFPTKVLGALLAILFTSLGTLTTWIWSWFRFAPRLRHAFLWHVIIIVWWGMVIAMIVLTP